MLLIEHDIDRVLALSDRITVLHQGRLIADGKPAEVANNPEVITAYLGADARQVGTDRRRVAMPASRCCRDSRLLQLEKVRAGYAGSRGAERSRPCRA